MKVGLDNAKTLAGILFIQSSATVDALEQSLKKVYSIKIGVFFGQEKRRVFDTLKSAYNAAILESILLDYLIRQSREENPDRQKITLLDKAEKRIQIDRRLRKDFWQ